MKKVTSKQSEVKRNQITPYLFIGIDVHVKQCAIAVWDGGVNAITMDWTTSADNETVVNSLSKLKGLIKGIVYEAGPTGFGLARALKSEGYPIFVAAPSLIPREPSKTNKTDRLDAAKLACFLGTGVIKHFVTVPEEKDEDKRHLARTLEQFKHDKNAARCRIKSFLISEGIKYGSSWSKNAREKMRKAVRGEGAKFSLEKKFEALEQCEKLICDMRNKIREVVKADEELSKRVKILESHPGVGEETAAAFALEMFPGRKFENGNQVGSFLGLAPQVRSSGETEIRGSIIKKGRTELRRLLVQCAWIWVRVEKAGRRKFISLCRRTGSARKAIVAMARRLGVHLWKMLETGTFYNAVLYANSVKAN